MTEIHHLRVKRVDGVYETVELDGKPLWTADTVELHLDATGARAEIFLSGIDLDLALEAETTVDNGDLVATVEAVLASAEPIDPTREVWAIQVTGVVLADLRARLAALRSSGAEEQKHG